MEGFVGLEKGFLHENATEGLMEIGNGLTPLCPGTFPYKDVFNRTPLSISFLEFSPKLPIC